MGGIISDCGQRRDWITSTSCQKVV